MKQVGNTLYLDCFSGISGDMLLGALLGAGLSKQVLDAELAKLQLEPFEFNASAVTRSSIAAISVSVISKSQQRFRNLGDIENILSSSSLDPEIISTSLKVFTRLASAEAEVHGTSIDTIHFHEVGGLDTIVDVVGTVAGLHHLSISRIYCSPLPLGRGFVSCAHGTLPLPAPAVCNLLRDVPVYGTDETEELVTPTGAALVKELVTHFGNLPSMTPVATGYGAGDRSGSDQKPNLLRAIIGHINEVDEAQEVEIIETNLDDWNSEGFPHLCERLLGEGALDVSLIPIQMKKGRPGFCLRVICHPLAAAPLKELVLLETSAIGLRYRTEMRVTLPRSIVTLETRWGSLVAKQIETPRGKRIYPEYEACRQLAIEHGIPLEDVYREVLVVSSKECC